MNKKAAFPGPGPASVNLVIVGAGRGGRSIIGLLSKNEMVRILKVVDINAEAPGMLLAEEMNIPSSLTYSDLAGRSDIDVIVNTTGNEKVQEELIRLSPHVEVIGSRSAGLIWDIIETHRRTEETLQKSKDAFLNMLEDISESYKDLQELFINIVKVMVNALDAKSPWTKGHSVRVAEYATEIARKVGLDEDEINDIRLAGLLHDIGKIGTYDQLLDKPSKLTDEEFAIVKKHPAQGEAILKDIKQLKYIIPTIKHHHERIDGRGYPEGLKGENIPFSARILHVADSFDAIMADRPYRPSPGREYAIAELKRCNGTQFDPKVVEAFLEILTNQ